MKTQKTDLNRRNKGGEWFQAGKTNFIVKSSEVARRDQSISREGLCGEARSGVGGCSHLLRSEPGRCSDSWLTTLEHKAQSACSKLKRVTWVRYKTGKRSGYFSIGCAAGRTMRGDDTGGRAVRALCSLTEKNGRASDLWAKLVRVRRPGTGPPQRDGGRAGGAKVKRTRGGERGGKTWARRG